MTLFTAKDYPKVLKAIEQKYTTPLNLNSTATDFGDVDSDDWVSLGIALYDNDPTTKLPGNLTTDSWWDNPDGFGELQKRFTPITLPDGTAGIEFLYFPLKPDIHDKESIESTYKKTNLSTLLTLKEFTEAVENEEDWVEECFAPADAYSIYFEVTPATAGAKRLDVEEYEEPSLFEDNPILLTHNNTDYNIYVYESQD